MVSLRQNLSLKIISVIVSILIYVYVQTDKNPTISRAFTVPLTIVNVAPGLEVEAQRDQVEVMISGQRQAAERVKEEMVRAIADLSRIQPGETKSSLIHLELKLINLPAEIRRELTLDTPTPTIQFRFYPQVSRLFPVTALFPKNPQSGFRYGEPVIVPARVTVYGREDRLNRVTQVVANAPPVEAGAAIGGEFRVSARDKNNNPIENVLCEPSTVQVTIALREEPAEKVVTVSTPLLDQPLPPYRIVGITATPATVRIVGRPAQINPIFTLRTEDIPARDLTDNQEFEAALSLPAGVKARDMDGKEITHVMVRLAVRKSGTPGTPPPVTIQPNSGNPPP